MKYTILHSCAGSGYSFSKGQIVDSDKEPKKAEFVKKNLVPFGQAEQIKEKREVRVSNKKAQPSTTRKTVKQ